jgi:tetratricopeptide (TPR) repeat protein
MSLLPGSLLLSTFIAIAAAQSSLPPLPRVALETFPQVARAAVSTRFKAASSRPDDAEAVGALGRILQAWEQWDGAHQAYLRAAALSPTSFDWTYLDAVVLQRLAQHDAAAATLTRALSVKPDYLPARLRQAEALLDAGRLD